jgi:hypothetical protein|eukprot:gene52-33_t
MEGGYLPWKTQTVVNMSPDVEYFTKSLPPPPSGHFWERQENGEWVLFRMPVNESISSAVEFTKPSIVEHTIMPTDTLQGLCLRYRVSAINLRRMNMFSGNNIQFKKTLLIPVEGGTFVEFQQNTEEVILQKFRNATQEGIAESRLYLDEFNWNLEAALESWKKDEKWEEDAEKEGMIIPPLPLVEFPDDADDDDVTVHGAIAPAAVAVAAEVSPAFISTKHPAELPAYSVEMRDLSNTDGSVVPLLA